MNRSMVMATVISMFAMGCGSDGTDNDLNTVGFSGPVNVRLDKFKDGDVRNGAFDSDKDINTESGNPYGGFLRDARASLGRDPAAVLIERMTFTLASDTRGVTGFEQFLSGTAVVYFATSSVTVNVGTAVMPTGAGPVTVQITAGRADLAPINARKLTFVLRDNDQFFRQSVRRDPEIVVADRQSSSFQSLTDICIGETSRLV